MVFVVGLLNIAVARWSLLLDRKTSGGAYLKVVWSVLGITWLFSVFMFVMPEVGLFEIAPHIGWDLVSVTGTAIVVYWLLRLQIGIWAKNLDL